MKATRIVLILILTVALLCSSFESAAGPTPEPPPPVVEPTAETTIVRVYYPDLATGNKVLVAFEAQLLETNYEQNYHVMQVTAEDIARLQAVGLRVVPDPTYVAPAIHPLADASIQTIPSYPCYRTVEETYAAAQAIVTAHPTLATWIDIGDTWEKATVTSPDLPGYDMMVLKLTNSAVAGPKPKLFITAAMHAREYTTAELALQFAEKLANSYGTDADATWILDYHEIHFLFQANPDGRKKAETGLSWRKNTHENCSTSNPPNGDGIDLNRNFSWQWACCGGSSSSPCASDYHGTSAASEPEVQAIQAYIDSLFPDQRGPGTSDPAPADATGLYIDLHSSGRLVLWPWAYTGTATPNATQFQTLGRKFAYFNGHTPAQWYSGLYPSDGAEIDYGYGKLGVASVEWELGTAFFQACSYFTSTLVPANMPALWYAAKVPRTPYLTPLGPDAITLTLSSKYVPAGTTVTLSATINDTRYSGSEPTQNIAAAEYYVDMPPWVSEARAAAAYPMAAADGNFNAKIESVTASVDTTGWSAGKHILFVRGQDANNNWGAFSAIFLTISDPTAVDVASFTATGGRSAITLAWRTDSEVNNLGFNLYRASQANGPRIRINEDLIPSLVAPGSAFGAVYSYRDLTVARGLHYFYWLEDVDIYGHARLHGPVEARAN
jgi:carboxypeptidase T